MLKPHSATGLVNRLADHGWIERIAATEDRRRARLRLTRKAHDALAALSATHRDEIRRVRPILEDLLAAIGRKWTGDAERRRRGQIRSEAHTSNLQSLMRN